MYVEHRQLNVMKLNGSNYKTQLHPKSCTPTEFHLYDYPLIQLSRAMHCICLNFLASGLRR